MTNNKAGYGEMAKFVNAGPRIGDWHRTAINSNVEAKLPLLDGLETYERRRNDGGTKEGFAFSNNWGKLREEKK